MTLRNEQLTKALTQMAVIVLEMTWIVTKEAQKNDSAVWTEEPSAENINKEPRMVTNINKVTKEGDKIGEILKKSCQVSNSKATLGDQ